jgi:hypothetical protein
VPYSQKEEAKILGARWDSTIKKWYFKGNTNDIPKFRKWILGSHESVVIAYEPLYIIEAKRTCYKCRKETKIIGFGIGKHSILSEYDNKYTFDDFGNYPEEENEIHLAWASNETDIPSLLLKYISRHYNVKTGYSGIAGKCFANHCDYCDSIQGNWYLFSEDSSLSTFTASEKELVDRMSKLKIYSIYTGSALVLNWNIWYCGNDWAYSEYCNWKIKDITSELNIGDI